MPGLRNSTDSILPISAVELLYEENLRAQKITNKVPDDEEKENTSGHQMVPYSQAIERNARRLRTQIITGEYIPEKHGKGKGSYIRKVKTREEEWQENIEAMELAKQVCALGVKIQEALADTEKPNESKALLLLKEFYDMPTTPLSIQYSPVILLTLKMCKQYKNNINIQLAAREGYDKCKAMFPFYMESSFEEVYIKLIKRMATTQLKDVSITDIIKQSEMCMYDEDSIDEYSE